VGRRSILKDGSVLGEIGKVTWIKSENEYSWKLVLIIDLANGEKHRSEVSIDLET